MVRIKVGDEVAVMNDGSWSRAKVTAIHKGGAVDVTLLDTTAKGTTITHVQHVSGVNTYWHSQNTAEKLSANQADPAAIELA